LGLLSSQGAGGKKRNGLHSMPEGERKRREKKKRKKWGNVGSF